MTGFFNPQGFLTAMRQEVTRTHKGWALDSVICQNLVTRFAKEDIHDSPPEGVYIHGLFLEGASLDRKTGKLVESRPKVLYEQMPVIYIYAINTTAGKDSKLYECPIYRKPARYVRDSKVCFHFALLFMLALQDRQQLHRLDRLRERHRSQALDHERGGPAMRHQVNKMSIRSI